jgi:cysteinyl-tRNA synthetase
MEIYNSLSRKKEALLTPKNKKLRLFVCGPTVYDDSHIGHARTYLSFDLFVRYLKSRGYKVFYLQNITNIDDKIIDRARQEKKNPLALARYFEKRYLEDMKKLGISSVDRYARATDFIPEIVKQVQTLIKKGYAYKTNDGYYFDVKKFKDYGKLSGRTALQAEDAVSRIDESVKKKNKGDFALWKFSRSDEPAWKTKLGRGRPGWHIEDTAISEKFFGPQYDIHGGAVDLKFPHHEAEIAQQEAASGRKPFVKIWMHTGFLTVNDKKMSKSLKNFITIRDFLKKYPADTLRFIVLKHNYQKPINYNNEIVLQAETDRRQISNFFEKLRLIEKKSKTKSSKKIKSVLKNTESEFAKALEGDFNTPRALAHIFELINRLEKNAWSMSKTEAKMARESIEKLLSFTGLSFQRVKATGQIKALVKERELYRANKQFTKADALRKKIESLGYEIEDTPLGPLVLPQTYAKKQNKNPAARLRS